MDDRSTMRRARLASRLTFFLAGFAMACWAPLVPFAKARLGLDPGSFGLLLLCFGAGPMATMPVSGALVARLGPAPPIVAGGIGLAVLLPVLAIAPTPWAMAPALLAFGAALGTVDVAMNVHAVEVERRSGCALMSGFHGLFSVGGLAGAASATGALSAGLAPLAMTMAASLIVLVALAVAAPRLIAAGGGGPLLALPRGPVVLIGALAFASFLVEGAMLDWGALFLVQSRGFAAGGAGAGYAIFSAAMVAGRLSGDRIVAALGARRTLLVGGVVAAAGIGWLLGVPGIASVAGFVPIGLGAANIVPVLFSAAGRQRAMPEALAIAAMSTLGYAGVLAGPALIGFAAQAIGLPTALAALGMLMLAVPLGARRVTRDAASAA